VGEYSREEGAKAQGKGILTSKDTLSINNLGSFTFDNTSSNKASMCKGEDYQVTSHSNSSLTFLLTSNPLIQRPLITLKAKETQAGAKSSRDRGYEGYYTCYEKRQICKKQSCGI
jgi:hypothetical protein